MNLQGHPPQSRSAYLLVSLLLIAAPQIAHPDFPECGPTAHAPWDASVTRLGDALARMGGWDPITIDGFSFLLS